MTNKRRSAERKGRTAEFVAETFLTLKGYRVFARRAKTHVGEIDLLALKSNTIISIEVKQRPTLEIGLTSVSDRNWQRIANATDSWLAAKHPELFDYDRRFDLIIVRPNYWPCHRKDTWRPNAPLT